jgi:hypothetical protein
MMRNDTVLPMLYRVRPSGFLASKTVASGQRLGSAVAAVIVLACAALDFA